MNICILSWHKCTRRGTLHLIQAYHYKWTKRHSYGERVYTSSLKESYNKMKIFRVFDPPLVLNCYGPHDEQLYANDSSDMIEGCSLLFSPFVIFMWCSLSFSPSHPPPRLSLVRGMPVQESHCHSPAFIELSSSLAILITILVRVEELRDVMALYFPTCFSVVSGSVTSPSFALYTSQISWT